MMRKALWIFLALAGCADPYARPLLPKDIPTAPYVEGTSAQSMQGSLQWEDGCLLFRSDAGDHMLPIWPRRSVFNGTALVFHRPGKAEQPGLVNQQIEIDGEVLPAAYAQANFRNYMQRCGGTPFFVADIAPAN